MRVCILNYFYDFSCKYRCDFNLFLTINKSATVTEHLYWNDKYKHASQHECCSWIVNTTPSQHGVGHTYLLCNNWYENEHANFAFVSIYRVHLRVASPSGVYSILEENIYKTINIDC